MRVCGVQKCLASAGEHTPPKAASRRSTQRKCKNTWCRGRTWGLALAPTPGKGGGMERETFREPQTTGHDSRRVSVMGTPGWMSGPCRLKCPPRSSTGRTRTAPSGLSLQKMRAQGVSQNSTDHHYSLSSHHQKTLRTFTSTRHGPFKHT